VGLVAQPQKRMFRSSVATARRSGSLPLHRSRALIRSRSRSAQSVGLSVSAREKVRSRLPRNHRLRNPPLPRRNRPRTPGGGGGALKVSGRQREVPFLENQIGMGERARDARARAGNHDAFASHLFFGHGQRVSESRSRVRLETARTNTARVLTGDESRVFGSPEVPSSRGRRYASKAATPACACKLQLKLASSKFRVSGNRPRIAKCENSISILEGEE